MQSAPNQTPRDARQSTGTEMKARRKREPTEASAETSAVDHSEVARSVPVVLDGSSRGRLVLFGIKPSDQVADGPVMRGFLEIDGAQGETAKVDVAAWARVGRDSGQNYLSLKVGSPRADGSPTVEGGPFYGRLFRIANPRTGGTPKVRYFGVIEDAERVGEGANGRGEYVRRWQLRLHAKRALSKDEKTLYIAGVVVAGDDVPETSGADDLPF